MNMFFQDATEPLTVIISPNNKKVYTSNFWKLLYVFMIYFLIFFLLMETEATNETHASPIAQLSTETPVFTPNQTHQVHAQNLGVFK